MFAILESTAKLFRLKSGPETIPSFSGRQRSLPANNWVIIEGRLPQTEKQYRYKKMPISFSSLEASRNKWLKVKHNWDSSVGRSYLFTTLFMSINFSQTKYKAKVVYINKYTVKVNFSL